MILNAFPDLNWLKEQAEKRFADRKAYDGTSLKQRGWPTVILNVRSAETYRDNIRGPLSLFTNFSGSSQVSIDGKSVLIKEGCFFLSNPDQRYTLEIHRTKPAETFNIHFGERFADEVFPIVANFPGNYSSSTLASANFTHRFFQPIKFSFTRNHHHSPANSPS